MPRHALRAAETADTQILIPAIAEDGSLFPIEKMEAHRRGQLHQAVSVFIFSGDQMLIQRRAAGKYHSGGQWANACCSHPNWRESPRDAAARRLQEELGFRVPLKPANVVIYKAAVGRGLTEHERVQILYGVADKARLLIDPDPSEVCETRWVSHGILRAEMASRPSAFAPWFRIYLERWDELALPSD